MPPVTIRCPRCHRSVELARPRVGQVTCTHCGHRWIPRRDRAGLGPAITGTVSLSTVRQPLPPPQPTPAAPQPTPRVSAAPDFAADKPPRSRARIRVSDIISAAMDGDAPAISQEGLGLLDALAAHEGDAPAPASSTTAKRDRIAQPAEKVSSQRLWGGATKDPLVGRELRGLRIERKIGEGGMGSVYEALQLSLERKVALKVLSPRLRGNASFIAKLEAEAKILARVNHPNILHVYDFGEEPSIAIYYMVMEYIDGSDLTELLQRRRRLGQIEALEIIRQAALGLDAAAQNGIIHRDIKPDNIMITKDGVCKVSDFGLATEIGGPDLDAGGSTGKGGNRVGTPAFMSPEQCQGSLLDVRSDVYSLGCTAYVALTGQLPFEAESPFEIMLQHRTVPPPSLRAEYASIDPEVEAVIHRMMAKRPGERFSSMAQLAQTLKALIDRLLQDPSSMSSAPVTEEITPDLPSWLSE